MEKIFKKSLALVLSAALCLTALVGCLTVSAEGASATVTVGSVEVNSDATKATVPVTVKTDDANGIAAAMFELKVDSSKLTFNSVWEESITWDDTTNINVQTVLGELDAEGTTQRVVPVSGETDTYRFLVEAIKDGSPDTLGYIKSATFNITFDIVAGTTGTIDIEYVNDAHSQACNGGTFDVNTATYSGTEALIGLTGTNGAVTVKAASTEPVEITNKLLAHDLYLSAAVGSRIAVNVNANNGLKSLGYSDYYLVIDYNKYGSGYKDFVSHSDTLLSSQKKGQNAKGTVDYFYFTSLALYEMPLEYTVTIYLKDDTGNTVAYKKETTSVVSQALTYAKKYSTDTTLLTALVDMVNYGDAVQTYFANSNQNSLIATAVSPKIGFEDYQQYASSADVLPAKFNDTKELVKVLDTTTLQGSSTVIIGASNNIKYTFLANNYDQSKMVAEIEYVDSYGKTQNTTINFADMDRAVSPKNGNVTYSCVYEGLAIYDVEKTVSVKLINDGVHEATYNYSLGKFVNSYIGNAEFTDVLTKMELFSRSARIQLVGK